MHIGEVLLTLFMECMTKYKTKVGAIYEWEFWSEEKTTTTRKSSYFVMSDSGFMYKHEQVIPLTIIG